MYVCMYVGVDYTYIDINALAQGIKSFLVSQVWFHKFGFKPLLGLEPMAPIRPQLLVSHANHSATETSLKRMLSKPMIYVVTRNHAVHP